MKKSMSTIGLLLAVAQANAMQAPLQETVHFPKLSTEVAQAATLDEKSTIAWSGGRNCTPYGFKPGTLSARCN